MTIKDIERLTGISKANIRFYETEGLIAPERSSNGYRTYNESHVAQLKRIRLLRALDIPIETIKEMMAGRVSLRDALNDHKARFARQYSQLELLEMVIGKMLEAEESYETLDVDTYLGLLEDGNGVPAQDVNSKINNPWRRSWARTLDFAIYGLMIYLVFPSVLEDPLGGILVTVAQVVLTVLLEPLLLMLFRTTLGKAVFGITVTDLDGNRLTYKQALDRTMMVLQHGMGFGVPYLSAYFQHRSLQIAEAGGEQIWELDSELTIRDEKNWRYLVFALCTVAVLAYPAQKEYERIFAADETASYQGEDPFGEHYWVEEVLCGEETDLSALPLVYLGGKQKDELHFNYSGSISAYPYDYVETVGTFVYSPPEEDPTAGQWMIYNNEQTYQLLVADDGTVTLDYLEYGVLQWSWKLNSIGNMHLRVDLDGLAAYYTNGSIAATWFRNGAFNGDTGLINFKTLTKACTMSLYFEEDVGETLLVTEELHVGDTVTTGEITLQANQYGAFPMEFEPDESDEEVYAIYYITWEAGEYIFGIIY